ncbi:MAG: hypothetical protein LUE11_00430 [Clostridia bacterium]|nr:hypothetical protein [Clostridia bacterium]
MLLTVGTLMRDTVFSPSAKKGLADPPLQSTRLCFVVWTAEISHTTKDFGGLWGVRIESTKRYGCIGIPAGKREAKALSVRAVTRAVKAFGVRQL